jgi:hypothetical protein
MNNHSENKNSRKYIALAGLTFFLPIAFLYAYSFFPDQISIFGFQLKKLVPEVSIPEQEVRPIIEDIKLNRTQRDTVASNDSVVKTKNNSDANKLNQKRLLVNETADNQVFADSLPKFNFSGLDSMSHRVLIMGDSETGGLCFQLNDYCIENGHKLVASIVWNSASIFNFAYSDTVVKVIKKYQPTYIFIVVGLNELYARDLKNRRKAAEVLAKKIQGIPYTWIGPANYMEDKGINQVFLESAESGTYFLTKKMDLPKGGDKRHPNKTGYRIWMDSLAIWVQSEAKYKMRLAPPKKRNRVYRAKIINLNAAYYRGY